METIQFMTSLLTFYLKGEIKQEQNFIKLKVPNTILSVIPLGAHNQTLPINQIASVGTDFHLEVKPFLIGLICLFIGFAQFGDSFFSALIWLAIGAFMAIGAFQTYLSLTTTAGELKVIPFVVFEKDKAEKASTAITQLIGNRMDDTNNRMQTDRVIASQADQTNQIVDAISKINNNNQQ